MPGSLIVSSQVANLSGSMASFENVSVSISFNIPKDNYPNLSCVYWKFSNPYVLLISIYHFHTVKMNYYRVGNGFWSTEGIQTVFVEGSNSILCLSNHFTSFAVLVDTTGYTTVIAMQFFSRVTLFNTLSLHPLYRNCLLLKHLPCLL